MSDATPDGAEAAMLRAYLADRDVPCPRCGYNLRAATGDRCAECGTAVRLGVHPVEPVLRAWVVTLVAAALGAGVGLLFLVVSIKAGLPRREFYFACFGSWACMPMVAAVARCRRQFIRLSTGVQWSLAGASLAWLAAIVFGLRNVR